MTDELLQSVPAHVRAFVARGMAAGLTVGTVEEAQDFEGEPDRLLTLEGEREQFEASGDFARVRWPLRSGKYWSSLGVIGRLDRIAGERFRLVIGWWRVPSRHGWRIDLERARSDVGFAAFLRTVLDAPADSLPQGRGDKRGGLPGKPRRA